MNSCLLLITLSASLAVQASPDPLFSKLDLDGNGLISASELNDSQRIFFRRALRVADKNEDGSLSAAEFSVAVSDPKPVELPEVGIGRQAAAFDVKRLDRNGDGSLTLAEVPPGLKERFEELLSRVGAKSIPVDQVQAYLRGEMPQATPAKKLDGKKTDGKKTDGKKTDGKKLDGKKLDGKEMPKMEPKNAGDRPGQPAAQTGNASAAIFRNLDRDSDGKLSESELPDRMRANKTFVDTDNDGSVSRSEFEKVYQRRLRNKKP